MAHKLFLILFCLVSLSIFAQTKQSALFMEVKGETLSCHFSHDASETYDESKKLAVYLCSGKNSQSLLFKTLSDAKSKTPDSWRHYSVVNGHYIQGEPEKLKDSDSKVLFKNFNMGKIPSEFNLLANNDFESIFSLKPKNGEAPSEFIKVQQSIYNFAQDRHSQFIDSSSKANEVSFTESGSLIKCTRFKARTGKKCLHYQCPNDQVLYFNPDDPYTGIKLSKVGNKTAAARTLEAIDIPGFGKIESSSIGNEYSEEAFYTLMTSNYSYFKLNLSACEDPALTSFLKKSDIALESVTEKLDQIQYKILVEKVDGALNLVSSRSTDLGNMCKFEDVYYDKNQTSLEDLRNILGPKSKNKVYRPKDAQKVFDFFKNQKDIPWGYPNDGCYARAHLSANRAEKELGIDLDKTWVFGNNLSPKSNTSIKWSYHVAASLNVKDKDGNVSLVIIDPALSDRPLKLEEWTALFSPSKEKPLRGSYKNLKHQATVKPTYTVTGNEVYNVYELSSGYVQSDEEKNENARNILKQYSEILETRQKK